MTYDELYALLAKYINHVGDCEGIDFIPKNYPEIKDDGFTQEELDLLWKAAGWNPETRKYETSN